MKKTRSENGDNGRAPDGRFAKGNPGGPGNPFARKTAQLRSALLRAVKPCDIRAVVVKLVELAKAGDVSAAKLVLDRCLGRFEAADVLEKLEQLERGEL